MKKNIARWILWCIGWKFVCLEEMLSCKKAIIIAAPHTSIWDFVIGKIVYVAAGLPSKFLVSDRLFVFPFNFILPWLGAYRLNRKHPKIVAEIVDVFKTSDCVLTICPEGRHAKTSVWGSGFYKIATKANVPVKIALIDYKEKQCPIGESFVITGDFEMDMQQLQKFYRAEQARYPERFAHHGER